jgi:hypothetical protein
MFLLIASLPPTRLLLSNPHQPTQVAAPRADIVVLLHPEGVGSPASAEAIKAAAAMALTAVGSHPAQRVVVQAPGE